MENKEVNVKLLTETKDILRSIYTACKTCYSDEDPYEIYNKAGCDNKGYNCYNCTHPLLIEDNECVGIGNKECNIIEEEKQLKLVRKVINSGHLSTVEHVNFTFSISGVSRALTHQLVRHRHVSFSQKSQRYVKENKFKYIIPETINKNTKAKELFIEHMNKTKNLYNELINLGIPAEDARYILTNSCETALVLTVNLRELIHICNLRLCNNAQKEIRNLVAIMKDLVVNKHEFLKEFLVPKCDMLGYCNEEKNQCGRKQIKSKIK